MTIKPSYIISFGVLILGGLMLLFFTSLKPKFTSSELKIALLDGERLKTEAQPFIQVQKILDEEHTKASKEILTLENQLLKEYEVIKKEKNPEIARKNKAEFDKKVAELEQSSMKKKTKLEKQANELSEKVQNTTFKIIENYAKEHHISIVINTNIDEKKTVFYSENRLDITDDIIKALERELPNLQLS